MRQNIIQYRKGQDRGDKRLEHDWYDSTIPDNAQIHPTVYIDTSYIFDGYHSNLQDGLKIGRASGCYDRTSIQTASTGKISIGEYSILNGTTIIANNHIEIGNHCMLAWGSVITDCWNSINKINADTRKKILEMASYSDERFISNYMEPGDKIAIEDNVWIGFDTIVLGGVHIGEGAVIGSKTIINKDIPPYAVVVGNPARVVKFLKPNSIKSVRDEYFSTFFNQDFNHL